MGVHGSGAVLHRNPLIRRAIEEQNDEWAVGRRYFSTESMSSRYHPSNENVVKTLLKLKSP
jgi:hypothetical protein